MVTKAFISLLSISDIIGIFYLCLAHFPCSSVGKESACDAGALGSIPGSGIFPGEGNGNPLQYSCLENPMDRGVSGLQSMGSEVLDMI